MTPEKNNTPDNSINPFTPPVYQQAHAQDEIDLRELFQVVWRYKWLTVVLCSIAIIASVLYALNAQQWWQAKGKVIEPKLNQIANLYTPIGEIENALRVSKDDKTANAVASLFTTNTLFKQFIIEFNASENKKSFIQDSPLFHTFLQQNDIKIPADTLSFKEQLQHDDYKRQLNDWANAVSATLDDKKNEVELSFQAPTQLGSSELLNGYVQYVSNKVKVSLLGRFNLFINGAKNKLALQVEVAEARAKQKLALLLKKTQLSYQIAAKSELTGYKPSLNVEGDLFQINLGEKVLGAQVDTLKSIDDLSLLEPSISQNKLSLKTLNELKYPSDVVFTPFQFIEEIEPPLNRAKPKRALIVVLATLFAGLLSIFIALLHHFITKHEV